MNYCTDGNLAALAAYERDFLELVEQNDHIAQLRVQMRESANQITPLVRQHAEQATRLGG